jgi:hypothetical protein
MTVTKVSDRKEWDRRYRENNRAKIRESQQRWRDDNREQAKQAVAKWHDEHPDYARNWYLSKTYGITLDEYDQMLAEPSCG